MANRKNNTPPEIDFAEGYSVNSTLLEEFRRKRQSVKGDASRPPQAEFRQREYSPYGQSRPESEYLEDDFPVDSPDTHEELTDDFTDSKEFSPESYAESPLPPEKKKKGGKGIFWLTIMLLAAIAVGFAVQKIKSTNNGILYGNDDRTTVTDSDHSSSVSPTDQMTDAPDESSSDEPTESQPKYQTLRPGDKNEEVRKMQRRLLKLGYMSSDSCTGYYGDFTKKRVQMFQSRANLKATGIADSQTLERLYADDAPKYH